MKKDNIYLQAFNIMSEFEKQVNPFTFFYKDFPVWIALRTYIYMQITSSLDPSAISNLTNVGLTLRQILSYIKLLKKIKLIKRSPILHRKETRGKYIFFSHAMC